MPDEEEWFENIGGCQPITSVFIATNWGNIALGGFIFLHSFYIHRLKYSKIRLLTEACAFGGILTGIFHLAYATNPEDKEYCGIIGNFLVSGVANIFVQLPDNLISLFTYIALNTAGRARKYMRPWEATITALYIIFVLFLPFIAPVTFIPLIVNENTDDYNTKVGLPLMFAYTYGYVLYNTYFTAAFCLVLYKIRFDKKSFYPPIAKEICIKCVAHFFISSYSVLQFYYFGIILGYEWVGPIYSLLLMASLHFIFNIKTYVIKKRLRGIRVRPIVPPNVKVQILGSPTPPD